MYSKESTIIARKEQSKGRYSTIVSKRSNLIDPAIVLAEKAETKAMRQRLANIRAQRIINLIQSNLNAVKE